MMIGRRFDARTQAVPAQDSHLDLRDVNALVQVASMDGSLTVCHLSLLLRPLFMSFILISHVMCSL